MSQSANSAATARPWRPAGLWRRLAAIAYDALLVTALLLLVTGLVIAANGGAAIGPQTLWFQGLVVAVCWLYFCWFWTHGGQTLGMRAWKLRLQDANGKPLSWRRATLRFVAAWLAALPLAAGYLWCLIDSERLSWHDRLSATRLVFTAPAR